MSFTKVWQNNSGWNTWQNNTASGEIRVYNDALKLPFNRVAHYGTTTNPSVLELCRYRFGQKQTTNSYGQVASLTLLNSGQAAVVEDGILTSNSTDSLRPQFGSGNVFDFPKFSFRMYLSFWFKATTTNYSTRAYLASYHKGFLLPVSTDDQSCANILPGYGGEFSYSIVIDTDKTIKAICRNNVTVNDTDFCVSPCGGDIYVDNEWHHVVLLMSKITNSPGPTLSKPINVLLIVDNQYTNSATTIPDSAAIGSSLNFRIGDRQGSPGYAFLGEIDELVVSNWIGSDASNQFGFSPQDFKKTTRFSPNIFVSPVLDTQSSNNHIASIIADFNTPNNTSVCFGFRASESSFGIYDTTIQWTGFTLPNQISSGTDVNLSTLGLAVNGRYVQVRALLTPSDDDLQLYTPEINYLEIKTAPAIQLLQTSNPSFTLGSIVGQTALFSGTKIIHKVSLDLSLHSTNLRTEFTENSGTVSFQAANFQNGRNTWAFQPTFHWIGPWQTSGVSIQNYLQSSAYLTVSDAVNNAPYLNYKLYFSNPGVYDLWGYGYTSGSGIYWSFNNDISDLRKANLGNVAYNPFPSWTKFGTINVNEGGYYDFTVYLSEAQTVILDQWYFTSNDFNSVLSLMGDSGYHTPFGTSSGPFNTAIRLRNLSGGNLVGLNNYIDPYGINSNLYESNSITAWLSSNNIVGSGKYNYEIRNNIYNSGVSFSDGLSIEFFQIGGSGDFFASWNYAINKTTVGTPFSSIDFGQTYGI